MQLFLVTLFVYDRCYVSLDKDMVKTKGAVDIELTEMKSTVMNPVTEATATLP